MGLPPVCGWDPADNGGLGLVLSGQEPYGALRLRHLESGLFPLTVLKRPRDDKEPRGAVGTLMPRRRPRRRKLPWLTFLLGLSLGYGLAKPAAFAQLSASLGEGAVEDNTCPLLRV